MAGHVAHLVSRLHHAVAELADVRVDELQAGKWPTMKRVLALLVEHAGPRLDDQRVALERLLHTRNVALTARRKAQPAVPAEMKAEQDAEFKTAFLRVVVDALVVLRWPPALEAFSDPLGLLMDDKAAMLAAIAFLLDKGVLAASSSSSGSRLHQPTLPSPPDGARRPTPREPPPTDPSATVASPLRAGSGRVTGRGVDRVTDGFASRLEPHSHSSPRDATDHDVDIGITVTNHASGHRMARTPPSSSFSRARHDDGNGNGSRSGYQPSQPPRRDFDELVLALEVAQGQNEALSRALRQVTAAVAARDGAEGRLGALLHELHKVVAEVVAVGGGGGSGNKTNAAVPSTQQPHKKGPHPSAAASHADVDVGDEAVAAGSAVVDDDLDWEFQQEVEREERATRPTKGARAAAAVGIGATVDSSSSSSSSSSSAGTHGGRGRRLTTGVLGPPKAVPTGSAVVWSQLLARVAALRGQWDEARRAAAEAAFGATAGGLATGLSARHQYLRAGPSSQRCDGGSVSSRLHLHLVLGVAPPLAHAHHNGAAHPLSPGASSSSSSSSSSFTDPDVAVGLDLPRVHALQRDLVAFADAAFHLCCDPSEKDEDKGAGFPLPDPAPATATAVATQRALWGLRRAAADLLLHLAAVAPAAPLAAAAPWAGHLTALDNVDHEVAWAVEKLSGGRRTSLTADVSLRLQKAVARARAEQAALARCLAATQGLLRQWPAAAEAVAPLLHTFGSSVRAACGRARGEVRDLAGAFQAVAAALAAAEAAREGGVAPLDVLAKGKMGVAAAGLIHALRLHRGALEEGAARGGELHGELGRALDREAVAFDRAKQALLVAAGRTRAGLGEVDTALQPGAAALVDGQGLPGQGGKAGTRRRAPGDGMGSVGARRVAGAGGGGEGPAARPEWTF